MKHRVPAISVCLLLGVLANVAVAWACAFWADFGPIEVRQYEQHREATWTILSWAGFGSRRIVSVRPRSAAYRDAFADGWLPTPPAWSGIRPLHKPGTVSALRLEAAEARGWPYLALAVSFEAQSPLPSFTTGISLGGVEIQPAARRRNVYDASGRTLPLRPIWGGFLGNTLLYAAAAWLVSRLPAARRRYIRHRRGLCPACGYPPGVSVVCTECGTALYLPATTSVPKGAQHGQRPP